jgi:hypothetical protein
LPLIVSLAANAALLGIVAGRFLSPAPPHEPSMATQLDRYGPTTDVVDDAWAQLPADDKELLGQQLRASWASMETEREELRQAGQRVYDTALAEPFDEMRLRDAVAIFQMRENRLQQVAEDILISHIGRMPAGARATAATGLLTPFNARIQRADGADKETGEGVTGLITSPPPPGPVRAPSN